MSIQHTGWSRTEVAQVGLDPQEWSQRTRAGGGRPRCPSRRSPASPAPRLRACAAAARPRTARSRRVRPHLARQRRVALAGRVAGTRMNLAAGARARSSRISSRRSSPSASACSNTMRWPASRSGRPRPRSDRAAGRRRRAGQRPCLSITLFGVDDEAILPSSPIHVQTLYGWISPFHIHLRRLGRTVLPGILP